ncbi:MAG: DUF1573 domain-containing protein [Candidatus Omnitrophica bacterium]|nr:DUF1573 domain-containing protein [Candidatus Omnitrophota bacterium]
MTRLLRIYALLAVFFFSLHLSCPAGDIAPLIEYDFGAVSSKTLLKHDFMLPEEITNLVTLCECIKAQASREKGPDGAMRYLVRVEFDPSEYKGPVQEDILTLTKSAKRTTLRIKAFVQ